MYSHLHNRLHTVPLDTVPASGNPKQIPIPHKSRKSLDFIIYFVRAVWVQYCDIMGSVAGELYRSTSQSRGIWADRATVQVGSPSVRHRVRPRALWGFQQALAGQSFDAGSAEFTGGI